MTPDGRFEMTARNFRSERFGAFPDENNVFLKRDDKDGVRKQKWQTTGLDARGNLRKAKEILKERIDEMENELEYILDPSKWPDIPFSRFLSDWLETVKSTILITTYSSYLYFVEKRINPYFDEKKITLQNVRTTGIQEYYNSMLKKGLKWNSVNKHHAVIRRALDYAVKMEYIPSNPALKIEAPKRQKYVAEHYDRNELQRLFEAIKGDPIEVPVILSAFYGLRRSEALGLKWSAVDFKEKTLCIRHTVCMMGMGGRRCSSRRKRRRPNGKSSAAVPTARIISIISASIRLAIC